MVRGTVGCVSLNCLGCFGSSCVAHVQAVCAVVYGVANAVWPKIKLQEFTHIPAKLVRVRCARTGERFIEFKGA